MATRVETVSYCSKFEVKNDLVMRNFTSLVYSTMSRGGAKGMIQIVPAGSCLCPGPSLNLCQLLAAVQVVVVT